MQKNDIIHHRSIIYSLRFSRRYTHLFHIFLRFVHWDKFLFTCWPIFFYDLMNYLQGGGGIKINSFNNIKLRIIENNCVKNKFVIKTNPHEAAVYGIFELGLSWSRFWFTQTGWRVGISRLLKSSRSHKIIRCVLCRDDYDAS